MAVDEIQIEAQLDFTEMDRVNGKAEKAKWQLYNFVYCLKKKREQLQLIETPRFVDCLTAKMVLRRLSTEDDEEVYSIQEVTVCLVGLRS